MFNAKLFIEDLDRAFQSKDWSLIKEIIDETREYMASHPDGNSDVENCHTDPDIEIVQEDDE